MGLFDNIIGTATEGVEPLGMDTIVDDSIPPPIGGNVDQEKEEENPNIVEGDDASSIIVNENSQPTPPATPETPPTIPDIDIGGDDMFNFSYVAPDAPANPVEGAIPDDSVTLNAEPEGIVPATSDIIEVVTPTNEVDGTTETPPESTESASPLIDLTETTPEIPPATPEQAETSPESTESASPLIDLTETAPEIPPATPEQAEVTETTIIDTNSPISDVANVVSSEPDDDVSPETLEQQLNNRISTFVADLENIKATEKVLISEKKNTLAQLKAEEQIVTANFGTERQEIEEAVKKLEEHQVQIDQTIALVKNTKIV